MEVDFTQIMELAKKIALLLEVLPPIEIKPLKIKDVEYIAILIQRKKMCV
jgi:hypothetical protein